MLVKTGLSFSLSSSGGWSDLITKSLSWDNLVLQKKKEKWTRKLFWHFRCNKHFLEKFGIFLHKKISFFKFQHFFSGNVCNSVFENKFFHACLNPIFFVTPRTKNRTNLKQKLIFQISVLFRAWCDKRIEKHNRLEKQWFRHYRRHLFSKIQGQNHAGMKISFSWTWSVYSVQLAQHPVVFVRIETDWLFREINFERGNHNGVYIDILKKIFFITILQKIWAENWCL